MFDTTFYVTVMMGVSLSNGPLQPDPPLSPINPTPYETMRYTPTIRIAGGLTLKPCEAEVGFGNLSRWHQYRADYGPMSDTSGYDVNQSEVDLRGRCWLTKGKWGAYAETGLALEHTYIVQWRYWTSPPIQPPGSWFGSKEWNLAPQVGAGIGYDIDEKWKVTVGATWTFGQLNVQQYMLGLRRSF